MQSSMHCTAMSACSGNKSLNTAVFVVQALVESLHVHFSPNAELSSDVWLCFTDVIGGVGHCCLLAAAEHRWFE